VNILFKAYFFLSLFLIISCSQDPINQYKSLAKDVLKLADATSVTDKKLKQEKLNALNKYVASLNDSKISSKCKVIDVVGYGYEYRSFKDIFSGLSKIVDDVASDVLSDKNLSENEKEENSKYWKINCIQSGKITIKYKLIIHVSFINDDELKILEDLSEGDNLSFNGVVTNAGRAFTTDLYLTFKNILWIEPGVKDSKRIFIN